MLRLVIALLCVTIAASQIILRRPDIPDDPYPYPYPFPPIRPPPPANHVGPYRLCTYSNEAFTKCIHSTHVAQNNSIPLDLECVQKDRRDNCLRSVHDGSTDMVVLTAHGYEDARNAELKPILFAQEDDSSLYIAVAPRNITILELQDAPIYLNASDPGALHSGIYFNLQRAHELCDFGQPSVGPYIRIVNSATYEPNDDEILICPNRFPGEFDDYKDCNVEADLERAVFVRTTLSLQQTGNIRKIFDTILARFNKNSPPSEVEYGKTFNFFEPFLGKADVLFKDNTVAFDLQPTYRNDVDEKIFSYLQCNNEN